MALRGIALIACMALAQAELINLTCEHIRAFVDGHNQRRLQVARGALPGQPPAQDMRPMVWDEELAAIAGAWVARNDLSLSHSLNHSIGSGRFTTVENLYMETISDNQEVKTELIPERAIQSWFSEHENYTFGPITETDPLAPVTGHYTQVVWAEYSYVGCGISQYLKNKFNHYILACNYGPADNFLLGRTPYAKGGPISHLKCAADNCRHPYGKKCSRRNL